MVRFTAVLDCMLLQLTFSCRSADGTTLYACSSEGHIAVMQFGLEELGHPAPPGAQKQQLATWGFTPVHHPVTSNGSIHQPGRIGSGSAPNVLVPRKKQARAQTPLLPIPPPGAPQKITINQSGKRRIEPTFLGLGGIVPRTGSSASLAPERPTSTLQSAFQPNASYAQPGPSHLTPHERDLMDARMQGTPRGAHLPTRVSAYVQIIGRRILIVTARRHSRTLECLPGAHHRIKQSNMPYNHLENVKPTRWISSRRRKTPELLSLHIDLPGGRLEEIDLLHLLILETQSSFVQLMYRRQLRRFRLSRSNWQFLLLRHIKYSSGIMMEKMQKCLNGAILWIERVRNATNANE